MKRTAERGEQTSSHLGVELGTLGSQGGSHKGGLGEESKTRQIDGSHQPQIQIHYWAGDIDDDDDRRGGWLLPIWSAVSMYLSWMLSLVAYQWKVSIIWGPSRTAPMRWRRTNVPYLR